MKRQTFNKEDMKVSVHAVRSAINDIVSNHAKKVASIKEGLSRFVADTNSLSDVSMPEVSFPTNSINFDLLEVLLGAYRKEKLMPLLEAEEKVKEAERITLSEARELESVVVTVINNTKAQSQKKGTMTSPHGGDWGRFGAPTGVFTKGVELYTGDEIALRGGEKAIVCLTKRGRVLFVTNSGAGEVTERWVEMVKITKHYHMMCDGEEIAKGRQGGRGFIMNLTGL